jgi:Cyclin, N-terminal domain/Cyclin, C-terminal domain
MDREHIELTLQILRTMLHQEMHRYGLENYFLRPDLQLQHNLKACPSGDSESNVMEMEMTTSTKGLPIDPECRFRMTEWCYQVSDFCGFKRETVAITISCLDRFVSSRPRQDEVFTNRERFQLAAMACLYSVVKIHEKEAMGTHLMAYLSRGVFSGDDIEAMEMEILLSIGFFVNPPTALTFSIHLLNAIPSDWMAVETKEFVLELAKYQTEVAVGDVELIRVKPSWIATASLINAMETIKEDVPLQQLIVDSISGISGIRVDDDAFRKLRIRLHEVLSGDMTWEENRFPTQIIPQPPSCMKDYKLIKSNTFYEEPLLSAIKVE